MSDDARARLAAFLAAAIEDPRLLAALKPDLSGPERPAPEVDDVGLTDADYEALGAFAGRDGRGKELISYALLHPALKKRARRMVVDAQRRNAQAARRAARPGFALNNSRVVEALILTGLETLRTNAAVKPAGRKGRDVGQAA